MYYIIIFIESPVERWYYLGTMPATSLRNITRFTYEFTSFQGWRVAICRKRQNFIRYFSDKEYGGKDEAFAAALAVRDQLLQQLRLCPEDPARAFNVCRTAGPPKLYPSGLAAPKRQKRQRR